MKILNKKIVLIGALSIICVMLTGCPSLPRDVAPTYQLATASDVRDALTGLRKVNEYLEANFYETITNPVFNTIETRPIELGYLYWRTNNEKWSVSYQVGFQTFTDSKGRVYWRLSHHITGTRSGREPRVFVSEDFNETEEVFFNLRKEISDILSIKV